MELKDLVTAVRLRKVIEDFAHDKYAELHGRLTGAGLEDHKADRGALHGVIGALQQLLYEAVERIKHEEELQ